MRGPSSTIAVASSPSARGSTRAAPSCSTSATIGSGRPTRAWAARISRSRSTSVDGRRTPATAGAIARAWEEAARAQEQAERARIDAVAARGEAQRLGAALRQVEALRGHDSDAPPTDAYASLPDPERQPLPAVSDDLDQSAPPSALVEPEPALAPTPAVEAPAPSETPVL
ncbi:MAG: hypothetical protein U0168_10545 [Nannocystaceae bacterium]